MTTLTLQQAFEACQKNETAWLNRKAELAAAEQEYQEQVLAGMSVYRAECRHCAILSMSKNGR